MHSGTACGAHHQGTDDPDHWHWGRSMHGRTGAGPAGSVGRCRRPFTAIRPPLHRWRGDADRRARSLRRRRQRWPLPRRVGELLVTAVFDRISAWRDRRAGDLRRGVTLGFVPTMGALHEGHLSLVERSRAENDRTLVSVFVNPTQFDDPADLDAYPRTSERDLALLDAAGVDFEIGRAHV